MIIIFFVKYKMVFFRYGDSKKFGTLEHVHACIRDKMRENRAGAPPDDQRCASI
jgi:hypothetical protein